MISCARSQDVFSHHRICFLLVQHCSAPHPLDAKQDKLPAFLGRSRQVEYKQGHVTDTQEIPLTLNPSTNHVITKCRKQNQCVRDIIFTNIISTSADSNVRVLSVRLEGLSYAMGETGPMVMLMASLPCIKRSVLS